MRRQSVPGSSSSSADLPDWARPYYDRPGGKPFIYYVLYGAWPERPEISAERYRTAGVFPGLHLGRHDRRANPDILQTFCEGYVWQEFQNRDPELAQRVSAAGEGLILKGELADQPTLNYLRDTVGLVTALLHQGGVALYDPFGFRWWHPREWTEQVFDPAAPVPGRHVVILTSDEDATGSPEPLTWFHTRGLRKFGRPDISVHGVPPRYHEAVIDLCERFIQWQALGGLIAEGESIRMRALPPGMTCHHAGDLDDPDFNNVHVEIRFPARAG